MESRQPYEHYEEKRKYPRIVIGTPIDIWYKRKALSASIHDLSPDGLQVRCDRNTIRIIHPSGKFITDDIAPTLDVTFLLPVGNKQKRVRATVKLYYFVLLPDKSGPNVACGLRFTKLKGKSAAYIEQFIIDTLSPVEEKILGFLDEPRSIAEIAKQVGIQADQAMTILTTMVDGREVIALGSGSQRRFVQFATAMDMLFVKVAALDARLTALEQNLPRDSE